MDDDSAKKPLISSLLDPPHDAKMKSSADKTRLLRCQTSPSVDAELDPTKAKGLFPGSNALFNNFKPSFGQIGLLLVIYLVVGAICFYLTRHQIKGKKTSGVLDALYFVIVTMTTVGYGDLVPDSATTKLLACAFVFSGMAIVALFLSRAADYLVEKQEVLLVKALHLRHKAGEAQILREIATNRARYKFYMTAIALLVLIAVGTLFLSKVEGLNLVDAFYCVCSTITTLGYGDTSFSSEQGRVFAIFWILTSTICLAQFFLYLAEMYTESRRQLLVHWVLTRRMTYRDLEAADMDEDGVVGAAEFLIYKLKEMGKICQDDIAAVMEEFEALDVDGSGTISKSDLLLAQYTRYWFRLGCWCWCWCWFKLGCGCWFRLGCRCGCWFRLGCGCGCWCWLRCGCGHLFWFGCSRFWLWWCWCWFWHRFRCRRGRIGSRSSRFQFGFGSRSSGFQFGFGLSFLGRRINRFGFVLHNLDVFDHFAGIVAYLLDELLGIKRSRDGHLVILLIVHDLSSISIIDFM